MSSPYVTCDIETRKIWLLIESVTNCLCYFFKPSNVYMIWIWKKLEYFFHETYYMDNKRNKRIETEQNNNRTFYNVSLFIWCIYCMKQKIFLALMALIVFIGGRSVLSNFMVNHQYYSTMFASMSNRWMLIWAIVSALIPVWYIVYSKRPSLKNILIMLVSWLLVFSIAFVSIKDTLNAAWLVMLLINVSLIFGLWLYSILSRTSIGSILLRKIFKLDLDRRQNMLLAFWLGLGAMMVMVHFLVIAHIFYPILTRLLFVAGWVAIWYEKNRSLAQYNTIISTSLEDFSIANLIRNKRLRIGAVLLLLSVMYFYYGFQLSFIPYSTAWDANHAYMYFPKVWAENHGALGRGNPWWAGWFLWFSYIAYFFSLIQPIKSWFWLSPDNIAVSMNFLSGLFVLIFGTGLVKEFVGYITSIFTTKENESINTLWLYTGRIWLLLWITSGMWAFLLFVDNKTDMWVLAMTTLAMLSGIVFLRYIHDHKKGEDQTTIVRYVWLSWLIFGLAVAAKPTAFIDVVVFVLLLLALWINSGLAIWLWFIVIAVLAKMQVLFTYEFISADAFVPLLIIGSIISILSLVWAKVHMKNIVQTIIHTARTIAIRWLVLVASLIIIKTPYLVIQSIQSGSFDGFAKWLLMGQKDDKVTLLAATDASSLDEQNVVDSTIVLPPAICSMEALRLSPEDLDKDIKEFEWGNGLSEDVGRYVWFGWKEFTQWLGYKIAKTIFSQTNKCYGWNTSAKILCTYEDAINSFDMSVLPTVVEQLPVTSQWYALLSGALNSEKLATMIQANTFNPAQMRDEMVQIRQRYQGRSIKVRENSLMVPYRYLVPWNAVFNRSLQNLSSYYTDIGFVRGIIILLQIIALIYAIVIWNHRLLVLGAVTFVGRSMWWLIAGWIVWYGIGLIIWSILHLCVFLVTLANNNRDDNEKMMFGVVIWLLVLWSTIQIGMNFMRISSQWWWGPFVWYKMSAGMNNIVNDNLSQTQEFTVPYRWESVFDLQFAHYNKFIQHVKDRPDEDGVSIAGTYLQYFLHNQKNVWSANIYRTTSDGNTCKSYLRFQRDNWKYIVIDPNILSVVMGEWNESLMHRFFAKRNPVTGRIDEDGEMTMLVKMWYDGYLDLLSTNNLWAKYAFLLSDEELSAAFGLTNRDDLVYMRAKMGVARFFPDAQQIIGFVWNTFVQRIGNGQWVGDVADVFGKIIDEKKVLDATQKVLAAQGNPTKATEVITDLTQDERFVLAQYMGLYNLLRQNSPQFQETVNQILGQSVSGSSQIIVFELK